MSNKNITAALLNDDSATTALFAAAAILKDALTRKALRRQARESGIGLVLPAV